MTSKKFWQQYKWTFDGPLIMPVVESRPIKGEIRTPALRNSVAAAITHEEIFGSVITPKELINLIRTIPCSDWLLFLSKIACALSRKDKYSSKLQLNLAQMVFPPEILHKIYMLSNSGDKRILFNIWQITTLAKLALLESEQKSSEGIELSDKRDIFSRCLLGINDYISSQDFDARYFDERDVNQDILLESLIRIYTFQFNENPKHILSRYYDLFFRLPLTEEAMSHQNHMIIKDVFQSLMDFPLELFLILGFSVYANYLTTWEDDKPPNNDKVIINKDIFFSKTKVPKEYCNNFLNFLTVDQNTYQSEHKAKYPGSIGKLHDFNIFRKQPLIALNDTQSVAINIQWLYEKLGEGVFWIISDLLENNNNYRTFFGALYHIYFTEIFRRIFPPNILQERVFCNVPYDGKRASDAIVYYPNKLVFFEAKWPTLKMEETMIPGSIESFNEDIDNIIVHSARQLDRNIHDFINGSLTLEGVTPSDIHSFYPVIVTARQIPLGPITTPYVLDRIRQQGFLCSPSLIRRLEIISIEELEYMEPLVVKGKTFPEIIDRKQISMYYDHPMVWHISKCESDGLRTNEYIENAFNELVEKIQKNLF